MTDYCTDSVGHTKEVNVVGVNGVQSGFVLMIAIEKAHPDVETRGRYELLPTAVYFARIAMRGESVEKRTRPPADSRCSLSTPELVASVISKGSRWKKGLSYIMPCHFLRVGSEIYNHIFYQY